MDGKRKVCGTCRWCHAYTDVCTNDKSEKCMDFVNIMEETCAFHEMWPGLNWDMDKIFSIGDRMSEQRETEHSKSGESGKKNASYK